MDLQTIGYTVHYVRRYELNVTQEEFADMLRLSKDTVSNIERGKVVPSTQTLVKLAKMTNRSVDYFLNGGVKPR